MDSKEIIFFKELHQYQIQNYIAKGSFGKVYYAIEKKSGLEVAIKITDITSGDYEQLYKEASILSGLNHPNIVKFLNVFRNPKKIFLIMEYVKNGSLNELLEERKISNKRLSDYENSLIIKSIINAVAYLHDHGIVHRDLKLENILIQDKNNLTSIKLIDFGLSDKFHNENKILSKFCGTTLFQAPELIKYQIYGKPVDIWSCGIILFMLCNQGKHPFYEGHEDKKEFYENLLNPPINFPLDFEDLPKNLFMKMTAGEPSDRHTAEMILNHPWITRKFSSSVPMTCSENLKAFSQQNDILTVTKMIYFMMFCKKKEKENYSIQSKSLQKKEKLHIELNYEENDFSNGTFADLGTNELKNKKILDFQNISKTFRIVISKSNSPIKKNKKELFSFPLKYEKLDELDKSKEKHQILNNTHYIKIEHSNNNNYWHSIPNKKNQNQSKNILEPNIPTNEKVIKKKLEVDQNCSLTIFKNSGESLNQFRIKQVKLQKVESPQGQNANKLKKEEKNLKPPLIVNANKKSPSISPKSNFIGKNIEKPGNSFLKEKSSRSLSIYTEGENNENFMKNEDFMLKILQPLNCDNLNKAKQFTELKGFFNSLILLSPTKKLSNVYNFNESPNKLNTTKKNKKN